MSQIWRHLNRKGRRRRKWDTEALTRKGARGLRLPGVYLHAPPTGRVHTGDTRSLAGVGMALSASMRACLLYRRSSFELLEGSPGALKCLFTVH